MNRVLVIRGATSADELGRYGLATAKRFAEADTVIGIDRAGNARGIKSREQLDVSFIDAESALGEFASVLNEIRDAYVAQAEPKDVHLAHAVVGLWLFYWINDTAETSPLPIDRIAHSDIEGLRKSAQNFIEMGFGRKVGKQDTIPGDGASDPAPA